MTGQGHALGHDNQVTLTQVSWTFILLKIFLLKRF